MAQIGIYIVYLIVALMFLNGAALAVLAAMPRFVQDDPNDIFSRLNGSLKAHALGWFRLSAEQWPVYEAETRLMHRFGYVYEPFVEFRHSPVTGITLNMSEHGFRPVMEQGPWPPPSDQYTDLFFRRFNGNAFRSRLDRHRQSASGRLGRFDQETGEDL
ncbi:hypothetical protein [Azospirillum cavernae]|uniref:hypothetical protein n=1 Tax=Azospirillum cavernae TaxID=2320860 RepID=UPI0011C3D109|nr:hypothetical protein [Azospirillum cavernae]